MCGLVEAEPQTAAVLRIVNDRSADPETQFSSRSRVRRQDRRNLSGRTENNLGQEGTHDEAIMNLCTGIDLFLLPQRLTNPVPAGIEIINAILQGAGIRDSYRNAAACPPLRSTNTDTDRTAAGILPDHYRPELHICKNPVQNHRQITLWHWTGEPIPPVRQTRHPPHGNHRYESCASRQDGHRSREPHRGHEPKP